MNKPANVIEIEKQLAKFDNKPQDWFQILRRKFPFEFVQNDYTVARLKPYEISAYESDKLDIRQASYVGVSCIQFESNEAREDAIDFLLENYAFRLAFKS